jgi:pSer/pThr/pTyr-binding forkhead associated (FHA) protein
MAFLYQIQADGAQGGCWTVGDKPLAVGRGDCADACIEDEALSRSHFLIVREGEEFFLIDLNSSNGTRVNDEPVSARKLSSNEIIMAGHSLFYFSCVPISTFAGLIAAKFLPVVQQPHLPHRHAA